MAQAFSEKVSKIFAATIDNLDVFGQLPSLRVLNQSNQKSSVGLFMTLILMMVTMTYLLSEVINMLSKQQPSMFASEELIFDTSPFELNNDNFTLALSVADSNMESLAGLGKYYNLQMQQCTRTRFEDENSGNITINLSCTDIPFETCNKSHFQTDLQKQYFQKIKLGSLQCINREFLKNTPPILKGQLNSMEYKFLLIYLKKCQNTTESQSCASEEDIYKKLQSAQYNIYSSDYLLQSARSDDPLDQIITPYYVSFSSTTSKKITQYHQIIQTTTDDGLLFQSLRIQENLKKGQFEPYSEIYNGEYIIYHLITIQSVQTKYFRSYIKIQTILAKIGGIWQLLFLTFSFVFKWLLQDLMLLKVSNQLFNFENNFQSLSENQRNSFSNITSTQNNIALDSLASQLKILLCCNKEMKRQFKKAKIQILKRLDIVEILKQIQLFETFIKLLINETQYQSMVMLSKPLIQKNDIFISEKQQQLATFMHSPQDKNEILKDNCDSILFRQMKDLKATGLENYIHNKLILEFEKNYPNNSSEIQSPKNQLNECKLIYSVDDINLEPKIQILK